MLLRHGFITCLENGWEQVSKHPFVCAGHEAIGLQSCLFELTRGQGKAIIQARQLTVSAATSSTNNRTDAAGSSHSKDAAVITLVQRNNGLGVGSHVLAMTCKQLHTKTT